MEWIRPEQDWKGTKRGLVAVGKYTVQVKPDRPIKNVSAALKNDISRPALHFHVNPS